jgi:hypothetical protein
VICRDVIDVVTLFSSEKHPGFIQFFGLAEDSDFPVLGFIPADKSEDDDGMVGRT